MKCVKSCAEAEVCYFFSIDDIMNLNSFKKICNIWWFIHQFSRKSWERLSKLLNLMHAVVKIFRSLNRPVFLYDIFIVSEIVLFHENMCFLQEKWFILEEQLRFLVWITQLIAI